MTTHDAVVKALKKTGHKGFIPENWVPQLADSLTGTSWSKATVKRGYEKAFVRCFVRWFRTGKEPDFEMMATWLDRPNLN